MRLTADIGEGGTTPLCRGAVTYGMDRSTFLTALHAVVVTVIVLGVGFIIFGDPFVTVVGILAVIAGLMGLMPVARYGLEEFPAPP